MSHRQDLAKYMKVDKQHTGSDWFPFGVPGLSLSETGTGSGRLWLSIWRKRKESAREFLWGNSRSLYSSPSPSLFLSLFFPKGRSINYHECPMPGTEMNMFIYTHMSTCRYYLCKTLSLAEIRVNQSNGLWFSLKWFKTVRKTSKIWCPGVP